MSPLYTISLDGKELISIIAENATFRMRAGRSGFWGVRSTPLPAVQILLLKLTFADSKQKELDITDVQAGRVYDHIASRIDERAMTDHD